MWDKAKPLNWCGGGSDEFKWSMGKLDLSPACVPVLDATFTYQKVTSHMCVVALTARIAACNIKLIDEIFQP